MVVNCEQVWPEISNFVEDDVTPEVRAAMEEHFRICPRCASVLQGTRNVVGLYGDARLFSPPLGFSWRLHRKLAGAIPGKRGTFFGWVVAVAAMGLVAGSFSLASSHGGTHNAVRSQLAQPGRHIPSALVVLVAEHSRVFHVRGCRFIHDDEGHLREMPAAEAIREGYAPCVRCLKEYVTEAAAKFVRRQVLALALR